MKIDECIDYADDLTRTMRATTEEEKKDIDFLESVAELLEELKELRKLKETYKKGMETSYATFMYNKAIDDFREIFLDKIANNYDYPNKHFKEAIYGVVNDAIVDAVEQLKG